MMEKEETSERGASLMMMRPLPETEFFLQWGNKKRMRCVRIRSSNSSSPPHLSSSSVDLSSSNSTRSRRRITSRFLSLPSHEEKHLSFPPQPTSRLTRNSEAAAVTLGSESRRVSPETEEERSSHTGGNHEVLEEHTINAYCHNYRKNVNVNTSNRGVGAGNLVWPKLCVSLSSKEKEEDFLAMKGCKLPQRPKKRAKLIQRTILLVSPGAWLADMSLERYEVREKKTCKKRPRGGLKGMGNLDSDSD